MLDAPLLEEYKKQSETLEKQKNELEHAMSKATKMTTETEIKLWNDTGKEYAQAKGLNVDSMLSAFEQLEKHRQILEDAYTDDRISREQYLNARKNLTATYRKADGIDALVAPIKTAQSTFEETTKKLNAARNKQVINAEELARGMQRATETYNKELATQLNIGDLIKEKLDPFTQFEEDTRNLAEVYGKTSEEYRIGVWNAKEKLKSASDVSKFFDASDTLSGRQTGLAEAYEKLEAQAKALNYSDEQLVAAKKKALKSFEEQSEMGRLMLEAQEKLKPVTEKLAETYAKIDEEAAAWGWSKEITDKMKELSKEKIVGKTDAEKKPGDNQALVKGSVAYVDFIRRDANKEYMRKIQENTARQAELLQQNVDATKEMSNKIQQPETV